MKLYLKINKLLFISFILFTSFISLDAKSQDIKTDQTTNLIIDKGFDTVVENCLTCHPSDIIINKPRDKKAWLKLIRWMQTNVGLWQFEPETENLILDYLSKNYSKKEKKDFIPNLNLNNIK